jgi:hypothetical protein
MASELLHDPARLDPKTRNFYRLSLEILKQSSIPFLVGGAYALNRYTGIERHTKDLDIFVLPPDCPRVLRRFEEEGYRTELPFPHWLGKAFEDDNFIDVIFASGNGICRVDEEWFAHSVAGEVLGVPVRLCPAEETIWSKAFIMERERYDGADVAHLLRNRGRWLDWPRLVRRFGDHWPVLLNHLILFRFIYPGEREQVPERVMRALLRRLRQEIREQAPKDRLCQGTLLSRAQYLTDIEQWGYRDARLRPEGSMTPEEIEEWTAPVFEQ